MNNQNKKPYLSVTVPLYNEVENVDRLWTSLYSVLSHYTHSYEVIFVDDGSTDGTRNVVMDLARAHPQLHAILFRANFGQSAAMAAGFKQSRGDVVVAMDGDLQNDPNDIPLMVDKLESGYDVVSGWRKKRKDKFIGRKLPSKIANRIICSVTNVKLHDTGCSLKAFRGELLRKVSLYGEMHRFIPALMRMEGAYITEMPVRHHPRLYGKSKYNLSRTFRVIMDLTTLRLLMRHLYNPLLYFSKFSFLCLAGGMIALLCSIYHLDSAEKLNVLISVTVLLLSSGFMFIFLGLVGKMITHSGTRKSFALDTVNEFDHSKSET